MVTKRCHNNFLSPLDEKKFSLLSYHESNLMLIARETMRFWLIINLFQSRYSLRISFEQICYKRSQGIDVTSLHCLLFSTLKNKDVKRISKSATTVVLALKFLWTLKLVFPLQRIKINNLIALRSTNQITEISVPWWLEYKF